MMFYHEAPILLEVILTLPAKQTTAEMHQSLAPTLNSRPGKVKLVNITTGAALTCLQNKTEEDPRCKGP